MGTRLGTTSINYFLQIGLEHVLTINYHTRQHCHKCPENTILTCNPGHLSNYFLNQEQERKNKIGIEDGDDKIEKWTKALG